MTYTIFRTPRVLILLLIYLVFRSPGPVVNIYSCVCACVFSTHTPWETLYLCCVLSHFSCILFFTLWTVVCQAPLSMGFPREEYWSGYHFLLEGIFANFARREGTSQRALQNKAVSVCWNCATLEVNGGTENLKMKETQRTEDFGPETEAAEHNLHKLSQDPGKGYTFSESRTEKLHPPVEGTYTPW